VNKAGVLCKSKSLSHMRENVEIANIT
jgi:hypothetical protein